jgi:hypothetical protein
MNGGTLAMDAEDEEVAARGCVFTIAHEQAPAPPLLVLLISTVILIPTASAEGRWRSKAWAAIQNKFLAAYRLPDTDGYARRRAATVRRAEPTPA